MRVAVRRPMAVALAVASTWACGAASAYAQEEVTTKTDGAKEKLDDSLQAKVDAGSTETVPVLVTVSGDPSQVQSLLSGDHTATTRGTSLVVGRVPVQTATKVAAVEDVLSVNLVQFKFTGQPAEYPADGHRRGWSRHDAHRHHEDEQHEDPTDVPYGKAPPLKGSNFEKMKKLNVLDARTHNFTDAWNAGYDGSGSTVGVMDGGT